MLDFTATDTTLPRIRHSDPMLSTGSLVLLDPMHPDMSNSWAGFNSGVIPNLAWRPLSRLLGWGNEAQLSGIYSNGLTPADGGMERTDKGGLHGMIRHTPFTERRATTISINAAAEYVAANAGNEIFLSVWGAYTRKDGRGDQPERMAGFGSSASQATLMLAQGASALSVYPYGPERTGVRPAVDDGLGERFIVNGARQIPVPVSTSSAQIMWTTGSSGWSNVRSPSWVLYRYYLEDLTVSGRTYAEADQIDYDLYSAEVMSPGGRYYDDTWTDPSTLD